MGWAGSALLVYSLMQARVLRFRVLNLVACVVVVILRPAGATGAGAQVADIRRLA